MTHLSRACCAHGGQAARCRGVGVPSPSTPSSPGWRWPDMHVTPGSHGASAPRTPEPRCTAIADESLCPGGHLASPRTKTPAPSQVTRWHLVTHPVAAVLAQELLHLAGHLTLLSRWGPEQARHSLWPRPVTLWETGAAQHAGGSGMGARRREGGGHSGGDHGAE